MRVAAIDIGTNSVLLLIAERRGAELVPLVERATITRLGQGVDRTRALSPEAVDRTLACLAAYGEEIRAFGVERIDAVGTSAMRDAAGGAELVVRARELLGAAPRVISGDEEAALTFTGALTGLALPPGPCVVFDVGGGSTEIIVGTIGEAEGGSRSGSPGRDRVEAAVSLDVGSVRLTERHVRGDPPAAVELAAVREAARAALKGAFFYGGAASGPTPRCPPGAPAAPSGDAVPLVGVAGTVTTLAALALDVAPYDSARVHGARLTAAEVAAVSARLAGMPLAKRRRLPALDPARADVIVAGAVLVEEILAWYRPTGEGRAELIASDRGVRWGLARRMV